MKTKQIKLLIGPLILIVTGFLLLFNSCLERREPMKHEQGLVVEKQYIPDTRQTVVGQGFSSNGNVTTTFHQIGEDEKYIVIFKCEHGVVFSINRSDLFGKLNRGDTVTIDYYDLVDSRGNVEDFDFINANVKR